MKQKGPFTRAALTFPDSAGTEPGGSSEGPHRMETWFSFHFHALGASEIRNHFVFLEN